MNRREKARERKRKARERRLRQQEHAAHATLSDDPVADEESGAAESEPNEVGASGDEAPDPLAFHVEERLLRRVARIFDRHADADPVERDRIAAAIKGKSPEELDAEFGEDPAERAQDLAFLAWDSYDLDEMHRLLDEALTLDADCTDARTLLAVQPLSERKRLEQLERVIEDAARALGGELRNETLWLDVHARPYLRARYERLKQLASAGRTAEAIADGEELLALDPDDNVTARNHLCGALLEAGELERARALLERFSGPKSVGLWWCSILHLFLSGRRREAAKLRKAARNTLPEIEDLIVGRTMPVQRDDESASLIDQLAADAHAPLERAWRRHKEARRWLEDGALASTAAERRAVADSYRPPVVALLQLGEPHFGRPGKDFENWPAYIDEHGLSAEHVADLLRMADDPALHEQDAKRDAVWGPVHAWRALGLLAARCEPRAADVTSLLLSRLREDPDDDWLHEDVVSVLGLVGAPAFDEAAEVLLDDEVDDSVRATVSCALSEIGERHAPMREPVIGKLAQALRATVEGIEETQRDDPDTAPDELVANEDRHVAGMLVTGLMQLHAGTGTTGNGMIALVERAWALGLPLARDVGTREQVLAEMRGDVGGE